MGARGRHGEARKRQMELQKGRIRGKKVHGIHKKLEKISAGQLRTMFPLLAHLSDVELRRQAIKELEKRG